ncbi:E3 ubiquitin-protein ligase UPL6 [Acorus calamus]|uniref:HECT-type E3 ubiquitin transferase n=1 Tax=Acorus calamus TaxID=4465 RepID=A0AAV9EY17_ACOCL|nr:E3 ubiquitin-protein ligase UPL6 [Acorus calamus]
MAATAILQASAATKPQPYEPFKVPPSDPPFTSSLSSSPISRRSRISRLRHSGRAFVAPVVKAQQSYPDDLPDSKFFKVEAILRDCLKWGFGESQFRMCGGLGRREDRRKGRLNFKGDVSELELYFVVINNEYGEQTESELLPGGKDRRVTNDNVRLFIHLVAEYRLNYQIRNQSSYFSRGFQLLIQKEWIDLFNEHELQLLISGSSEHMDLDDLRSNANYSGGYHPDHQIIRMFWEVVKSFSTEHQKKFLKFVTGCSRGPLLGFKYLEPKFCIQRAAPLNPSAENLDRLPTSATCMNLLKLPPYNSKEQMATKLMYAISADAGFDLS